MPEILSHFWLHIVLLLHLVVGVAASGHVVLYKRDERAATGWVATIWLAPLLGVLLYVMFGVNRIERRAEIMRGERPATRPATASPGTLPEHLALYCGPDCAQLESLIRLVGKLTDRPLLPGSAVTPLIDGHQAYPAMLEAIAQAQRSISLATYIFDNDHAGQWFRDALREAVARGVEVRVLIDDVGSRYRWPSIVRSLRRAGVPVAKFNPTLLPWKARYSNLRNHRKILVVDGRLGFTGGMNIREGHLVTPNVRHPIHDVHFRVEGPIVEHLQEVFAGDWAFATRELLQDERWFPPIEEAGSALARGISDGPDEDFDKLRLTLLGALSAARKSVLIVTPYFLPDFSLITSLGITVMRGVDVRIVLPEASNLKLVKWASLAVLPQVLEHGCRVWFTRPPFDHTKLMIVDDVWSLLGSANWDPRSLRLNFEFNVEVYDRQLAELLRDRVQEKIDSGSEVTSSQLAGRPLPLRLRDGIVRLASPYL